MGCDDADDEATNQSGSRGYPDPAKLVRAYSRLRENGCNKMIELFNMRAGCNLRHHTAERMMQIELRSQYRAADPSIAANDCRRRLVTARFQAQEDFLISCCHIAMTL